MYPPLRSSAAPDNAGDSPRGDPASSLDALVLAGLDATTDSIAILRPMADAAGAITDAEIVFLNAAVRRRWFADAPNDALRGRPLIAAIPALRDVLLPMYEQVVRHGGEARGRQEITAPDGPHIIELTVSAFGEHVIQVGRDVTAEHEDALARKANEERLRVTIEGVDGIVSYRAPGEQSPSISSQVERILGRSPAEVASYDTWIGLIHPDDLPVFHGTHQGPDASWDIVYRMRHADGRWIWVSDRGRRLGGNPDGGAWGVITDISASHAASEQFRAVFEENPESIGLFRPVLDEQGVLVDAECMAMNRTGREEYLRGRLPGDAVGLRICRDLGQEENLLEPLRETHRTRAPFRRELHVVGRRGERWIDISIFPFEDGFAIVGRDTTTTRTIEARLHQAERLEALGQLAGGVAHDFNNLLAAIRGYGQFVLDELPEGAAARPDMEEVLRTVDRASALTRQLLMFARRKTVMPQRIDPVRVIDEAVGMIARLVGEHITVITDLPAGLGYVVADPGELERAIVNLAVNARDAMPEGGRLTISAGPGTLASVDGRTVPSIRVTVADTGSGMDEGTLSHVFEPFFTTKAVGHGTGLGLAAVYGFVQASGRDVSVTSHEGTGTTFVIDLPVADGDAPPVPASGPKPGGGRGLILVAEDDRTVLVITTRMLESLGYQVIGTGSGDEALALVRDGARPDMLLSDVRMPGLQGPQLAVAARQIIPGLPVLLCSAFADTFDPASAGLEDVRVLQKPFSREQLAAAVHATLAQDMR